MATLFRAIWHSAIGPIRVTWRALNRQELSRFSARYGHLELTLHSPMAAYVEVCQSIIVESSVPVERLAAGIIAQIALHQLNNNPFSGDYIPIAVKLEEKRDWLAKNWLESASAIIASVFRVSFEEIDKWDADTFFQRFVQAEYALGGRFDPVDPRAPKQQPQQQQGVQPQQPRSAREAAYLRAKARRQRADLLERQTGQSAVDMPLDVPVEPRQAQPVPPAEEFTWQR